MSWQYILTACIRVSSSLVIFLLRVWCHPCTLGDWYFFSCGLLSLYPAVHFVSMWLNDIMAIRNSKGDRASPWKIPLCFSLTSSSCSLFHLQVFMVLSINFMSSCDILYILRQRIIQLCETISCSFLYSIQAIPIFFRLVLLSLRMSWSM